MTSESEKSKGRKGSGRTSEGETGREGRVLGKGNGVGEGGNEGKMSR